MFKKMLCSHNFELISLTEFIHRTYRIPLPNREPIYSKDKWGEMTEEMDCYHVIEQCPKCKKIKITAYHED
jgi:hypothetical protein